MVLLVLAIVFWLPGAVIFRLPILDRARRADLSAEERAFWAIVISVTLSLAATLALAAAHRYSLPRLIGVDVAVTALAAAGARFRLRFAGGARRPGATLLVPLALFAICLWRFFPPSEYVIGGKDPGVYVNEGIQIAQRGTLFYRDPVVASVPPFARDLFFPDYHNDDYYSLRFMGFFVQTPDTGATIGQFPHLFPASIAIGYGVDGLTGARGAVDAWAILGVLAVYFLVARLAGWPAAAAAAVLLTLNVVEVWFSRYPNTEVVMQALGFAALLANARAHVDNDRFFAPVAGSVAALLLFLRFDAVLIVGALIAGQLLGQSAGQRLRWSFWVPLAVATPLWLWYLGGPMRAYANLPIVFVTYLQWWQIAAVVAVVGGTIAAAAAARRRPAAASAIARWVPSLLTAAVLLLAAYALLLRHPGGRLAPHDAYALRTFTAFYVTLPALIAALIGYALVARYAFWRDPAFMVTLTGFSLFFFYKIRIVPDHFWMARRFLPIILPGTLVLVAIAALMRTGRQSAIARVVRLGIGLAFLVLVGVSYARAARPIVAHVEYAGIIPKLEALTRQIQPDDLLIVESRDASDLHVLALPLAYIYDRQVLLLTNPVPDKAVFGAFLQREAPRYRRVLFLGSGGTDLLSPRWSAEPIAGDRFVVPEYDSPRDAYPRFDRGKKFDYTLYAFGPPVPPAREVRLDVGGEDVLNVVRFHAREITDGRTFRWTQQRSFLSVPSLRPSQVITMWMSNGGRPSSAAPAEVTIRLGETVLGRATVADGFKAYDFVVPDSLPAVPDDEAVRLTIETVTWNPHVVLGTGDDRDLGVMVDRVAIK